jgi:formate dehydrogenase major subunit/formate dehydrogenase alpha subunit
MVTLKINGESISAQEGKTILEVAKEHGIEIPTLCYHQDLTSVGSCRLCLVEVEGWSGQVAACTLPVSEGINVQTETPSLKSARKMTLELLLQSYCDSGEGGIDTEFMQWVDHYGARLPEGVEAKTRYKIDSDANPFVWVDMNKCILCTRCVQDHLRSKYDYVGSTL